MWPSTGVIGAQLREVRSAVLGGGGLPRRLGLGGSVVAVVAVGLAGAPEGGVAAGHADQRGDGENDDPAAHHHRPYPCAARLRRADRSIFPAARTGISSMTTTRS